MQKTHSEKRIAEIKDNGGFSYEEYIAEEISEAENKTRENLESYEDGETDYTLWCEDKWIERQNFRPENM